MQTATRASSVEHTSIGRIVVPAPLPDGFALFYTTADYDGAIVPELTDILRQRFGVEADLVTCAQVHGAVGVRASRPRPPDVSSGGVPDDRARRPIGAGETPALQCDALYTDERGVALGIKVADCLPVSLCDPANRVIANIHSGWRGAVQNITAATLDTLARETAFEPREAYAYLGPSIRVCCFEVGEEVAAQFDARFVDRTRGAKPHVDLAAFTQELLRRRGVGNIIDTKMCTKCGDPLFHSYRRDRKSGRNLAIAAQ